MGALVGCAFAGWVLFFSPVALAAEVETGTCVDEKIKADLDAKRRRRFVKTRLFQKTNRHELTLRGGYYVSDLFDGSGALGAAYTYHLTEDFAVEAAGLYTRLSSVGAPELERNFQVLGDKSRHSVAFSTNLVFSPIYAKFQSGASVAHFDVLFTAGAGVVDSDIASGVAGNAGIGFVFFTGDAWALRFDFRDYVYQQELLAKKMWVNDLVATIGISVFLPFRQ